MNPLHKAAEANLSSLEYGNTASSDNVSSEGIDDALMEEGGASISEFQSSQGDLFAEESAKEKAAKEARKALSKEESKAVSCLRLVVILVLLGTAIGVSVGVFVFSSNVEESFFKNEFTSVASVVLRSFVEAVEKELHALDSVSSSITSHALTSGSTFPNVTVPDFGVKAATLRAQTGTTFSFFLPLVTDETRAGFEAYTVARQEADIFPPYMQEEGFRLYQDAYFGLTEEEVDATEEAAVQEEEKLVEEEEGKTRRLHAAPPQVHPTIHEQIWGFVNNSAGNFAQPQGSGPFLPLRQMAPLIPMPGLWNFDFFAYPDMNPMLKQTVETGNATLSYMRTDDHEGTSTEMLVNMFLTLGQYRHENITFVSDPMTEIAYPVFDSFDHGTKQVAGLVTASVLWRLFFYDVLPDTVKGVICVISTNLGEQATFRVDGRTATYVGPGDLHEPAYDNMYMERGISEFMAERASPVSVSYTSVELDVGYTTYSLRVYPSDDMRDIYTTSNPMYYAIVVAFIFVFTCAVFLLYDYLVEYRQRKIVDKAVRSQAVVTSLFPETVHDRLFRDSRQQPLSEEFSKQFQQPAWKVLDEGNAELAASVRDILGGVGDERSSRQEGARKKKGRPIADKFPDATVFFADIAGFTKWSSSREPEAVFELLEALYGVFDKVALRRDVFKVETIGDCYMAVTGVPRPQDDHAVRMVKFGNECMIRMEKVLEELQLTLGEDTKELSMRVGIHSGPVTAGVLRGDKGRFQLFGDTVNTASRMESNGVKGRIHCSEATAKLLPNRWLVPREDKIVAKGKGEMTTFFVEPARGQTGSQMSGTFLRKASMDQGGTRKTSMDLSVGFQDRTDGDDSGDGRLCAANIGKLEVGTGLEVNKTVPLEGWPAGIKEEIEV